MKIGVVHVNTEEASGPYTELITANLERAKRDGTEIVHRYVRHLRRATDTAIAYPTMLNKVDVVAEMVGLERDGADAVMVACSGDPGVAEARSAARRSRSSARWRPRMSLARRLRLALRRSSPSPTRPGRRTWTRWSSSYGFSDALRGPAPARDARPR